mmetsp:Transcript_31951/g.38889  ORF Transcript_31951/g.38889 Transcript_31951/m.38889 type:complete len:368 (+) Transcript_31951:281-1384(+)
MKRGKLAVKRIFARNKSSIAEKYLNSDSSASSSLNRHRTRKILIENDEIGVNRINSYDNIEESSATTGASSIGRVSITHDEDNRLDNQKNLNYYDREITNSKSDLSRLRGLRGLPSAIASTTQPKTKTNKKLERDYWKNIIKYHIENKIQKNKNTINNADANAAISVVEESSIIDLTFSQTLIDLGNAQLRCREHGLALKSFKQAVRIRRKILGDSHLSVGKALDRVGLACARMGSLDWALVALSEAFKIRFDALGPWHVDVADSLNNMAGVYLRRNELIEACEAYEEVLSVRRAVFGPDHPSVAVTLNTLAKIYLRSNRFDEALSMYYETLRIYRSLKLGDNHPTVQQVLRDVGSAERILVSMGYR